MRHWKLSLRAGGSSSRDRPEFWQSITGDGWRINASTEHQFCDYLEAQIEREILDHLVRVNAQARARGILYSAGSSMAASRTEQ